MTDLPPTGPARRGPTGVPPTLRSTGGLAAVAAAATPVVAAALLSVVLVATGCRARPPGPEASPPLPPAPLASGGPAATIGSAAPSPAPFPPGAASRLLVVVAGPAAPRAAAHDLARPDDPARPLALPDELAGGGLAGVAAAHDGRLAVVGQDGSAWTAPAPDSMTAGTPAWRPVAGSPTEASLPGPVLGATWSIDGAALVLLAGAPGAGVRRTAIVTVPLVGAAPARVEVPLEADGPALAALPRGIVAFVGRDFRDRGVLARITAAGSFATLPVAARAVAAGGDLLALVDDRAVRVGTLSALERGLLPAEPLPLVGADGIGAVAIAPDGGAVAVVRLDSEGAATRVETLRRTAAGWIPGPTLVLDARDATASVAWLP